MSSTMPCQALLSGSNELIRLQESRDFMIKSASIFKKYKEERSQLRHRNDALLTTAKLLIKPSIRLIASTINQHRTTSTREHGSNAKSSSTSSGGSNDPDSPRSSNSNSLATSVLPCFYPLQYLCSVFHSTVNKLTCYATLHAAKPDNTITSLDCHSTQPQVLNDCILRLKEVIAKTGLSRSMIYVKMDEKSPYFDPTFPQKIKLGLRSIGFFESEVNHWISQLKNTQTNKGGV